MPGNPGPSIVNAAQHFDRFDHSFNFFNGLLGGLGLGAVIPETNWFSAEGVPIMPVDDQGRSNAYPLMPRAMHAFAADLHRAGFGDVDLTALRPSSLAAKAARSVIGALGIG